MSDEVKKFGMEAFDVMVMSNKGVKVPLSLPDGTETGEFLIVFGGDTKEFRGLRAQADYKRLELAKDRKDDPIKVAHEEIVIDRELVASLVGGWSFEQECTKENVIAFFASAPQIQKQVDRFAGDYSNFFKKPLQD